MIFLIITAIILIAIILSIVHVIKTYNFFIYNKIKVDEKWSQIDVALKKKYDMIPVFTASVKGYIKHEKKTLSEITALRSEWSKAQSINEKINLSNALESMLGRLMVVVEQYPQLKADSQFTELLQTIRGVENEISHYRRAYNRRVSKYNRRIEYFPNSIIANMFGFKKREFFSLTDN